jgi:hypothetical protein
MVSTCLQRIGWCKKSRSHQEDCRWGCWSSFACLFICHSAHNTISFSLLRACWMQFVAKNRRVENDVLSRFGQRFRCWQKTAITRDFRSSLRTKPAFSEQKNRTGPTQGEREASKLPESSDMPMLVNTPFICSTIALRGTVNDHHRSCLSCVMKKRAC